MSPAVPYSGSYGTMTDRGGMHMGPTPDMADLMNEMVLGTQVNRNRRREMLEYDGPTETDEQIQVQISGSAGVGVSYVSFTVAFQTTFIPSSGDRSSSLIRPHFTYGYEITNNQPIMLSAFVSQWATDTNFATIGATITWGSSAPDQASGVLVPFIGVLHLNFEGMGVPQADLSGDALMYFDPTTGTPAG